MSVNSDTPDVFDELSAVEIEAVLNFTRKSFSFPPPDGATGNVSTIAVIELRSPQKQKVLQYLDDGVTPPARFARVVLYR